MQFTHLHVHSGYSLLDSMVRIGPLMDRVVEHGQNSIALTDHGTLAGVVKFTDEALKRGLKPILGCEMYIAPDTRFRKKYPKIDTGEVNEEGKKILKAGHNSSHLILLAKTAKGWDNLRTLCTLGFTEGVYNGRPRIDHELLARYSEGLICSTACMGGDISIYLKAGLDVEGEGKVEFNPGLATAKMAWYTSLFGNDFWIELQEHGNDTQTAINDWYRSRYPSSMIYASADCHYILEEDHDTHDTLIAAAVARHKFDPNRWHFPSDQCWLKSTEEMAQLFYPEELENTQKIADSVEFILPLRKQWFMPDLPVDITAGYEKPEDKFIRQCWVGLGERIGLEPDALADGIYGSASNYKERLDYEMSVFIKAGFVEYALILWDLMEFCKRESIFTGDGRGSGAGSLVLFALGVTNVDPIQRDCPFERFINPGRLENFAPPDVDLDFPQSRRQEILAYLRKRYGEDNVAQIGTYATLGVPALVKKLAPVLGLPIGIPDKLTACIPGGDSFQGKGPAGDIKGMTFDDVWHKSEKFRKLIDQLGQLGGNLMFYGNKLQELGSHASTHASGVIITNRPVVDVVPLMVAKAGTKDEITLAQMDMFDVEALGLLKFDILGLKTLDVLATVRQLIRDNEDAEFDYDQIDLDDPKAYELLQSGHTVGIFQAEGEGFGRLIPQIKPTCVEDLAVITSLCRPGPSLAGATATYIRRRQGNEAVSYEIPQLESILGKNYGVLTFQEDIMNIAHRLAGFTLAEADELRKVMGKKQKDKMPKYRVKLIEGLESVSGISPFHGEKLWDQMAFMAEYVFNKAHAMAYSYTTAKCAWAKAHYPAYFLSAAMTAEISGSGDGKQLPTLVRDAKLAGCRMVPPDINLSDNGYTATNPQTIILGLKSTKGVGDVAAEAILAERKARGLFTSRADFRARLAPRAVNSTVVDALVKAGAFASLEGIEVVQSNQRLHEEFELFGFYLSAHPCERAREHWLTSIPDLVTLESIESDWRKEKGWIRTPNGKKAISRFPERHCRVYVTKLAKQKSRRNNTFMLMLEIEDETQSMKMIVNEKAMGRFGQPNITKGCLLDLKCRKEDPDRGYQGYVQATELTVVA